MAKSILGWVCVAAIILNLLNLIILGFQPIPFFSTILCAFGAYNNLK